jgi:hypothetical protein
MAGATAVAVAISCAGPAQAQTKSVSPFQIVEASGVMGNDDSDCTKR